MHNPSSVGILIIQDLPNNLTPSAEKHEELEQKRRHYHDRQEVRYPKSGEPAYILERTIFEERVGDG